MTQKTKNCFTTWFITDQPLESFLWIWAARTEQGSVWAQAYPPMGKASFPVALANSWISTQALPTEKNRNLLCHHTPPQNLHSHHGGSHPVSLAQAASRSWNTLSYSQLLCSQHLPGQFLFIFQGCTQGRPLWEMFQRQQSTPRVVGVNITGFLNRLPGSKS